MRVFLKDVLAKRHGREDYDEIYDLINTIMKFVKISQSEGLLALEEYLDI